MLRSGVEPVVRRFGEGRAGVRVWVGSMTTSPASLGAREAPREGGALATPGTSDSPPKSPTISLSLRPMTAPPCETLSAPVTRRFAPARPKLLAARFRFGMIGRSEAW